MIAELIVERKLLRELMPHPKNPRVHSEEGSREWDALKKSLEHDYFDPLVLNGRNGMLVSGHFRRKVLKSMGVEEVDVVLVDYDEPTHLARLVAANRQFGEWDEGSLGELVSAVEEEGVDSWLAGFVEEDWDQVLGVPEDLRDDSAEVDEKISLAEELQKKWQVQPGELFEVDGLRLMCADCTLEKNWERLLDGEVCDMVWTDPPYNVDYGGLQRRLKRASGSAGPVDDISGDNISADDYSSLLARAFMCASKFTKPGGAIYIAHADANRLQNQVAAEGAGWLMKQNLIWVKSSFTLGRQDYQWQHEPILYGWKEGAAHFWKGGYSQATVVEQENLGQMTHDELLVLVRDLMNDRGSSVIREPTCREKIGHPTVKPLPLVARHIWNSCPPKGIVLELFGGSGTTLLAAHQVGRRAVATELDPKFCAVALQRMEEAGLEVKRYVPEIDS